MNKLSEAIKAGQIACDAYSAAVKAAGYKSRWDRIDYDKHPAVKAARDAHHAAGQALHEAFEESRQSMHARIAHTKSKTEKESQMSHGEYFKLCMSQSPAWLKSCAANPTINMRPIHVLLVRLALRRKA